MDNFLSLKVTYAALETAFQKLGFQISIKETHRLYEHKASGSIHAMPLDIPMDQPVRPAHLSAARHAVVAFKVADEATLTKLLTGQTSTRRHPQRPITPVPIAPMEVG